MAILIVNIADCKVSRDPADVLVTHALGSCIAVLVHDPVAKVAGLLHYMLPESSIDVERARRLPFLFADTGIPLLLCSTVQLGAAKSRMVVTAVGGAQMLDPTGTFNIGRRNRLAMTSIFAKLGIPIHREAIGGTVSRTVRIDVASGRVQLWMPGGAGPDTARAQGEPCRP
jgi:chemotaxis protein CheD